MSKLQYFRFLKDYGIHRFGRSVMEMEQMLEEDVAEENYHNKPIFFRDFLNALIRISYYLFQDGYDEEERRASGSETADGDGGVYIVSTCFKRMLRYLLVPPESVQINGYFFTTIEKCQEVMKHAALFAKMYARFRQLHANGAGYTMTQRHLVFVFDELRLLSDELTASKLVDILTKEDRDEEGYFNLGENIEENTYTKFQKAFS